MPLRQLSEPPPPSDAQEEMIQRLVEEWRHPQEKKGNPVLVEEKSSPALRKSWQPLHLYVIWDEWGTMDQMERSGIVLEAFKRVRGEKAAMNVTVAMGLRPIEAKRLGLQYK